MSTIFLNYFHQVERVERLSYEFDTAYVMSSYFLFLLF